MGHKGAPLGFVGLMCSLWTYGHNRVCGLLVLSIRPIYPIKPIIPIKILPLIPFVWYFSIGAIPLLPLLSRLIHLLLNTALFQKIPLLLYRKQKSLQFNCELQGNCSYS